MNFVAVSGLGKGFSNHHQGLRFAAESTLGRLVKWLRLAGFDTVCEPGIPDARKLANHLGQGRIVLTRTERIYKALNSGQVLLIKDNNVGDQFRQVIQSEGIKPASLEPFMRCSICNQILEPVGRDTARGLVPDYIWQTAAVFKRCKGCFRIYWPGSHARRVLLQLENWLK